MAIKVVATLQRATGVSWGLAAKKGTKFAPCGIIPLMDCRGWLRTRNNSGTKQIIPNNR